MVTALAQTTHASSANENKKILGQFLRRKRESLDPIALGIISSGRRRTSGLRREEVAQLADIGTTWYTWLEQGRDIKTSPFALASVCEALHFTKAEMNYAFHLATLPIPQEKSIEVYQTISNNYQAILDQLMPFPAAIQTTSFDILGFNKAFCKMMSTDLNQVPESERNCLIQSLTNPVWANAYENQNDTLANMAGMLRATVAKNPDHPRNQYIVQYCCQASEMFNKQWHCKLNVCDFENKKKRMHHPVYGDIHFTQVNWWESPSGAILSERLMIYIPETEQDKQILIDMVNN